MSEGLARVLALKERSCGCWKALQGKKREGFDSSARGSFRQPPRARTPSLSHDGHLHGRAVWLHRADHHTARMQSPAEANGS
jgi:hypothetical protein